MTTKTNSGTDKLTEKVERYANLQEPMTMHDYLEVLHEDARPARMGVQRINDMIQGAGTETYREHDEEIKAYNFFQDVQEDGSVSPNAIYGLDRNLKRIVKHFRAAALRFGAERRVLLLHGPVGSAKSTIATLLKRGLERETQQNPIYTFRWKDLGDSADKNSGLLVEAPGVSGVRLYDHTCEMHEEPLKLLDLTMRAKHLKSINETNFANRDDLIKQGKPFMPYPVQIDGELCPHCVFNYELLMKHYDGNWDEVMKHVEVFQFMFSESKRVGIATFQPKDEKNQDSTELTGNIDYNRIARFGSDSDPRAFNFDGELCVANRGIIEMIEILKLDTAFLYDLLTASQERMIKPKKFAQTSVDLVILGHTNEEEFLNLQRDELMKAFKDRTRRIDIPYNLGFRNERKIYEKSFSPDKVPVHIAPFTIEVAAMWSLMTRLEAVGSDEDGLMSKLTKMKLYDGERVEGWSDSKVREERKKAKREGLEGISTRFVQDEIASAIVDDEDLKCVTPFQVLHMIESDLKFSTEIENEETVTEYVALLSEVKTELTKLLKDQVQQAVSGNPKELQTLCDKYIDNVMAYKDNSKLKDPFNPGKERDPDESLMQGIEDKLGVSDATKSEFRETIVREVARIGRNKEHFRYDSHERLHNALTLKLFEDKKDTIALESMFVGVMDKETTDKIENLKNGLIKEFGYCEHCAKDTLSFVASIFARGDAAQE